MPLLLAQGNVKNNTLKTRLTIVTFKNCTTCRPLN